MGRRNVRSLAPIDIRFNGQGTRRPLMEISVYLSKKCLVPSVQLYSLGSLPFFLAAGSLVGGYVVEIRTGRGQGFKLNGISQEGPVWLSGFPLKAGRNLIEPAQFPCRYLLQNNHNDIIIISFEICLRERVSFDEYLDSLVTITDDLQPREYDHDDDDVQIERQSISNNCPITLQPIRYPAKGARCKHVEVFALISMYLIGRALIC